MSTLKGEKRGMNCYTIEPKTKEYKVRGGAKGCELPLSFDGSPCPHKDCTIASYPAFKIAGLEEPFAILIAICDICAPSVTQEQVLTDERWKRIQMILIEHDIEIPKRATLKMEMIKAIYYPRKPSPYDDANFYSYAMAA